MKQLMVDINFKETFKKKSRLESLLILNFAKGHENLHVAMI